MTMSGACQRALLMVVMVPAVMSFTILGPSFASMKTLCTFQHRKNLCHHRSTSLYVASGVQTLRAGVIDAADEPEGGWAPLPNKRVVTNKLADLVVGQKLKGVVRNVEDFGCFVDVGAERDGFLHVKDLSHDFVHSATDLVRSGKQVEVYVKYVEKGGRSRGPGGGGKLGLTLLKDQVESLGLPLEKFKQIEGEIVEGRILRITNFGVYMDVGAEVDGFLHCSHLPVRKNHMSRMSLDELIIGRVMKVRITDVDMKQRRISLTGRKDSDNLGQERPRFAPPPSIEAVFQRGAPKP